jgi:hypothetical protein
VDPNEALKRLREIVVAFRDSDGEIDLDVVGNIEDMVDYFEALDEWIMKGGFLPRDWSK